MRRVVSTKLGASRVSNDAGFPPVRIISGLRPPAEPEKSSVPEPKLPDEKGVSPRKWLFILIMILCQIQMLIMQFGPIFRK